MEKEKIYELKIEEDDDVSGIDSISLVDEPAIEINWLAFNKEKELFYIPEGEDNKYVFMLSQHGEPEENLINEGYKPFKIGNFEVQKFLQSDPNAPSEWDTDEYRIRYKYMLNPQASGQKPIETTTRDFCRDMIRKNYVYRVEDMDNLTNDLGSSALVWRGSYNCRHVWSKILYKKEGDIVNKASVNKNKVEIGGFPTDMIPDLEVLGYDQPDTRTKNPSFSKEKQQFKIDNEEKKIVVGPAMVPNLKIFRRDKNDDPYYVFFSEETIRMIAEKYMKNKYTDNNDIQHTGIVAKDVYVIESWIKEDDNDKSSKYGFGELPIGTWFVSMKIKNDKVWNEIKDGKLNGFSVSGFFEEVETFNKQQNELMFLKELAQILKGV